MDHGGYTKSPLSVSGLLKRHILIREVKVLGFPVGQKYQVKTTHIREQWQLGSGSSPWAILFHFTRYNNSGSRQCPSSSGLSGSEGQSFCRQVVTDSEDLTEKLRATRSEAQGLPGLRFLCAFQAECLDFPIDCRSADS